MNRIDYRQVPHVASGHLLPRVPSGLQFMCHAWDTIPRVAPGKISCHTWHQISNSCATRGMMKPSMLACFHSPPPAWFSYHTWPNAARSVRPPPGACATRGMHAARSAPYRGARATRGLTPHAPPLGGACATRGMHAARAAPAGARATRGFSPHSHRTRRPSPCLCAPSGLLLNSASLHLLSPHK